ncbi:MAG: 2-enoyl thioester reductase domain-containing protein [Methylacidiphilales bacterium]|nr:2-enoyl thioester reductase domain-containing protein [Candidatus Methylacidiphilales bacterium]
MSDNLVARYSVNGNPVEVLEIVNEPQPQPSSGEILIEMLYASINPSDINMLEGTYGIKATLPAIAGNEGCGKVLSLGSGVTGFKTGDLVKPPASRGTWRQRLTCPASECIRLPESLSPENASMIYVNPPTAWRMLHDTVKLQPGEWVIQNAANSAVGRSVIQIAKALGWRTINLVRREELVSELRELGGDIVAVEDPDLSKKIKEWTGGKPPRLALNAVGGDSASLLAKCLADGGHHVTYGAMSKQPLKLSNGFLIFKNITFHGFWMTRWYKNAAAAERDALFNELAMLFAAGKLKIAIDKIFPLAEAKTAVGAALQEKRGGKILLKLN